MYHRRGRGQDEAVARVPPGQLRWIYVGVEGSGTVLIGRDWEIAQLRGFVAACEDGPCALTIEGAAGIGKTALLDVAIPDTSGLCVLRVRCAEAESGLAYVGLCDLLGERASPAAAALPPPQRRATNPGGRSAPTTNR